jgi:hypothetical protein
MNTSTNPNPIRIGSIVELACPCKKELKNFTIIEEGENSNVYLLPCVVVKITAKYFRVKFPHKSGISVLISKDVFTSTKESYGDIWGHKPRILIF